MKLLIMIAATACFTASVASAESVSASGCVIPDRITYPTHQQVAGKSSNGLLKSIYNLHRSEAVLKAGSCSCQILHPSWDFVPAEYERLFGNLQPKETTPDWLRDYEKKSREAFRKVVQLCGKQGVY